MDAFGVFCVTCVLCVWDLVRITVSVLQCDFPQYPTDRLQLIFHYPVHLKGSAREQHGITCHSHNCVCVCVEDGN